MEHIERTSLISRMRITRLNSISATLLIRLFKIFTRPYMNYACTAFTPLNKTQRQKHEVIQNHCLRYARRAVESNFISNNEIRSFCNIVNVEQPIPALADSWWRKASRQNDDMVNFIYHHQANTKTRTPLKIIKGNRFF